jgi:hypothetical protein
MRQTTPHGKIPFGSNAEKGHEIHGLKTMLGLETFSGF